MEAIMADKKPPYDLENRSTFMLYCLLSFEEANLSHNSPAEREFEAKLADDGKRTYALNRIDRQQIKLDIYSMLYKWHKQCQSVTQ